MRYLLGLIFFCQFAYSKPPMEGGRLVPFTDTELVDVRKLETSDGGICTSTKVSDTLVLTAAHCVIGHDGKKFFNKIKPKDALPLLGVVDNIHIHPKYKQAVLELHKITKIAAQNPATFRETIKHQNRDATLYDVAFIQIQPRDHKRTDYPEIISDKTKFSGRGKVRLAGYGTTHASWDGKKMYYGETDERLRMGDNAWVGCQGSLFEKEVDELAKLSNELESFLKIQSSSLHTIVARMEYIESDGRAMILPGDSGSPALEYDANNKLVVTAVASNVHDLAEGTGKAKLIIEYKGNPIYTEDFKDLPKDWGLRTKNDKEFPEIQNKLKELDLYDELGNLKEDVFVKRQYTRHTTGNYADLSHPHNQSFIKSIMNSTANK